MSIDFYNKNANEFFDSTVNADMSYLYNIFEKQLEKKGEILDLGCGSGRDSKYFLNKGYAVVAIDLSEKLAEKASKYIGQNVIVKDMREIDYKDRFIGIWACASFLHLTESDILKTLEKAYLALKDEGIIYLSFKYGEENYKKNGRDFTCFTEKKFFNLIKQLKFKEENVFITKDVRKDRENEKWLNIILKKSK